MCFVKYVTKITKPHFNFITLSNGDRYEFSDKAYKSPSKVPGANVLDLFPPPDFAEVPIYCHSRTLGVSL